MTLGWDGVSAVADMKSGAALHSSGLLAVLQSPLEKKKFSRSASIQSVLGRGNYQLFIINYQLLN
nr:hypothetical protein [Trichodesmium sp. MO_231.B1]